MLLFLKDFLTGLVFKNTLWQAIGKGVSLTVSLFLITPILTSYLGESGYGVYVFVTAFVLFFGNVADWGTNIIGVRESAVGRKNRSAIFNTVLFFRLMIALLILVLINSVIRVKEDWSQFVQPVTVASLVIVFLSLKTSFGVIFHTLLRFKYAATAEIVGTIAFLISVWYAKTINGNVVMVMWGWVISTAFATLVAFWFVRKLHTFSMFIAPQIIKRIFLEALPTGALLVVFTIYNRVDIVILEHFRGVAEVGVYGLAYKVYDNGVMGAAFLMNSLFPLLAVSFKKKRAKKYLIYGLKIIFLFGIFVGMVMFFLSTPLIRFLGQGEFVESEIVLKILSGALVLAYLNHLIGYSLIAFNKQRTSLQIAVLALLLNITLNTMFIPKYSYIAAAYITVITEGFVLILTGFVLLKMVRITKNG